jgi:hypothetical protein
MLAPQRPQLDCIGWAGPGIEVKDGEAPMSEDHPLPVPGALVVGTAATHTLQARRSSVLSSTSLPAPNAAMMPHISVITPASAVGPTPQGKVAQSPLR